jgi:hypothetical protein
MPRYLEQANECTDPTTGDFLWVYDASAGATDKDRKVNISRFAILANAQTFTAGQTFAPAGTSTIPATINMPTSTTVEGLRVRYNGTTAVQLFALPGDRSIVFPEFDNGSSYGPYVNIGRNSNGSTPAAGHLLLYDRDNDYYSIWPDGSGNLRIVTNAHPTSATDTGGTVIGTQTSYAALKEDITPWNGDGALDAVLACKLFGYRFKGDESQRQYHGIVINDDDRGAWFSENDADNQTPALNERNLFGYLIAAIKKQQAQIDELKEKLNRAN